MASMFNALDFFQLKPNEPLRNTLVNSWNNFIEKQKMMCLPRIRSNATKWPELKESHINSLRAFFTSINTLGLLDNAEVLIEKVERAVEKVLSKKED
jgi:hypothetical protein